jgi:7-dehydrocholesterol reductase
VSCVSITHARARRSSGFIWDFYWGTELHPTVFGYNIKQLVNCRISVRATMRDTSLTARNAQMIGWQMACWASVAYQYDRYGYVANGLLVSALLQFVYLYKFFLWESGYFASIDIQVDMSGGVARYDAHFT